jgi:Bacterial protein of unknown function (DUF899)
MSAFALEDGTVYHTYSTYARGLDALWGMYQWLDRAPRGRNEKRAEDEPSISTVGTTSTAATDGSRARRAWADGSRSDLNLGREGQERSAGERALA